MRNQPTLASFRPARLLLIFPPALASPNVAACISGLVQFHDHELKRNKLCLTHFSF